MPKTMKPVESYEAEQAFKEGKHILVLNLHTKEIIYLNSCKNQNYIVDMFTRSENLFYIT